MIDAKIAFEYAKQLEEYVKAGNTIEQICACENSKEVKRHSYYIMANPSTTITVEQVEESISSLDAQKAKLEEIKVEVAKENEKLPVQEEENALI